jgi:hypothetical protein
MWTINEKEYHNSYTLFNSKTVSIHSAAHNRVLQRQSRNSRELPCQIFFGKVWG